MRSVMCKIAGPTGHTPTHSAHNDNQLRYRLRQQNSLTIYVLFIVRSFYLPNCMHVGAGKLVTAEEKCHAF